MFTDDELRIWIKDKRDTFVKAMREMRQGSGTGTMRVSYQKKWILAKFDFIKPYIVETKASSVVVGTRTANIVLFVNL